MASSFPLPGILYRDWHRLRARTGDIAPLAKRRATRVLVRSLLNEGMHFLDRLQFGERIDEQDVGSPIIVLGLARSGTTFLYELLCCDPEVAHPTYAQAIHPHTFLTREGHTKGVFAKALRAANLLLARLEFGKPSPPVGRGLDQMLVGPSTPYEDEFALLNSGQSKLLSFCFPRDFGTGVPTEEKELWQRAWLKFLRKLSLLHPERRLALKSPWHMARIPWILELFPDAKFVFISREPARVFESMMAAFEMLYMVWPFQSLEWRWSDWLRKIENDALLFAAEQTTSYLSHRSLIPAGHLHELRYEQLVADPEGALERLYESLALPGFQSLLPHLRENLRHRQSYRTNRHPRLSLEQHEKLRQEWKSYYEAFGYELR